MILKKKKSSVCKLQKTQTVVMVFFMSINLLYKTVEMECSGKMQEKKEDEVVWKIIYKIIELK